VRAISVARFGGPEVLDLGQLPDPAPEPGQLVVAASACDVLFVDAMIRAGKGADYFSIRPPYIPGNGVGGTVVGVAEAGAYCIDYAMPAWTDAVLDATGGRRPTVVLDGWGASWAEKRST
jgi:NADPH:quinone reductase-like Zn-dependent oxidoreductase